MHIFLRIVCFIGWIIMLKGALCVQCLATSGNLISHRTGWAKLEEYIAYWYITCVGIPAGRNNIWSLPFSWHHLLLTADLDQPAHKNFGLLWLEKLKGTYCVWSSKILSKCESIVKLRGHVKRCSHSVKHFTPEWKITYLVEFIVKYRLVSTSFLTREICFLIYWEIIAKSLPP